MKKIIICILICLVAAGCSGKFWAGTGTGALGTGVAYEVHLDRQMKKIDADLKDGKIDQQEYDIRKSQIERDSVVQKFMK